VQGFCPPSCVRQEARPPTAVCDQTNAMLALCQSREISPRRNLCFRYNLAVRNTRANLPETAAFLRRRCCSRFRRNNRTRGDTAANTAEFIGRERRRQGGKVLNSLHPYPLHSDSGKLHIHRFPSFTAMTPRLLFAALTVRSQMPRFFALL